MAARQLRDAAWNGGGCLMAGYADAYANRGPSLVQILQAAGMTRAQRDQRDLAAKRMKMDQEDRARAISRQDRLDSEAAADRQGKIQAGQNEALANRQRYFANLLQARPGDAPKIIEAARAQGVEIGQQADPVSVAQGLAGPPVPPQQTPSDVAMGLQGQAAGILGQPESAPGQAQPMSPIGKKVSDLYGFRPGTEEFREAARDIQETESAASLALEGAKTSAEAGTKLRQEFQKLAVFKDTMDVATQWDKVRTSSASGPGDLNLIFGYMKMLDPGSAVREGEFANAENAQGAGDRVRSFYNRVVNGERLNEATRAQFKKEAGQVWQAQKRRYGVMGKEYKRLAEAAGVDPRDVVLDFDPKKHGGKPRKPKAKTATDKRGAMMQSLMGQGLSRAEAFERVKQAIAKGEI
jgi:hypothetical protein